MGMPLALAGVGVGVVAKARPRVEAVSDSTEEPSSSE